jgi:hypothetical protein
MRMFYGTQSGHAHRYHCRGDDSHVGGNAHMQRRTDRKSARGGRALLTGLVRCGRCGRTDLQYRVVGRWPPFDLAHAAVITPGDRQLQRLILGPEQDLPSIGIGGVRIDRAIAAQIVEPFRSTRSKPRSRPPINR